MSSLRIGLLEGDAVVAQMLEMAFADSGWSCDRFETIAAIQLVLAAPPHYDLLVLDWMVPDGTLETLIPWVRKHLGWEIPILIESFYGDELRIVHALGLGADDYVVKPLRLAEVKARIQVLLRSRRPAVRPNIICGAYCIDAAQRELKLKEQPIQLTRIEFDLALYFFQHIGELLSRDRLLTAVWGISASLETRTVDHHVSRLRKKLRLDIIDGIRIICMSGYGYRLEVDPSHHQPSR